MLDLQTLGAITGVLAFIGFLAQWRATARRDRRAGLMVEIRAEATRAALIEAHDAQPPERYFRFLDRLLAWAGRVYGPRWSLRSFGICLSLAYLYPFSAALVA